MKKLIENILKFFARFSRKKELKNREKIYDSVINKLQPALDEKQAKQQELISLIKDNFQKDTGIIYGSEFIPTKQKNNMHVMQIIQKKYGERMKEIHVKLTYDLRLICI